MYRSSVLGRLAVCRRCVLTVLAVLIALLGLYEIHYASANDSDTNSVLRRLAVYSVLVRMGQ